MDKIYREWNYWDHRYRRATGHRMPKQQVEKEKPVAEAGTSLVRPGDITDALDSRDLLDRLIAVNTDAITKKVDQRIIQDWIQNRRKELRSEYINKARAAYEKMWKICSDKKIGHHWNRIDVRGYSVNQCEDCRFCTFSTPVGPGNDVFQHGREQKMADEMNTDLIKSLADRMIEVDIEAGIFSWPTTMDYPNIVPDIDSHGKKRKWIFG